MKSVKKDLRYKIMEDEENTLYQQFALSHRHQAEYFQPLDPCTWGQQGLKTWQLWFHEWVTEPIGNPLGC